LGGLLAAVGVAPAFLKRPAAIPSPTRAPIALRPETRAVSRKEGSC